MSNTSTSTPLWADEALGKTDISGRPEFAQAVATRIDSCIDGQGSTVFGLVGPWGSGKTTLLKDIVSQLDAWTSVWFNPWSVADTGSISGEFLSVLGEAFPQASSVQGRLASYARFGTPLLKMIPVVGDAFSAVAEAVSEQAKGPAWHTAFGQLSQEIAAQHARVLVVIDDVDRLDSEELRALLRVVRLLGRFANVHYLMAYDQATLDGVLTSSGANGESSAFMEKIVQYPFEVPPTPTVVRRRWARSILDVVSPSGTLGPEYLEHKERLVRILASGIETPRGVERLREQMLSLGPLATDAEVDLLDFAALTWLRISHHQVWNHIRLNSTYYLSWQQTDSDASRAERTKGTETLVLTRHSKPVHDVLNFLFEVSGSDWFLHNRGGRLRSARHFDRYFHIGLAEDDVSERAVQTALASLADDDLTNPHILYLFQIILGQDEERSALCLDIASGIRRSKKEASVEVLEFVRRVHIEVNTLETPPAMRLSLITQWLMREISLALKSALVSIDKLVSDFGYSLVISSARTMSRFEDGQCKQVYANLADQWFADLGGESLPEILKRNELISMSFLCLSLDSSENFQGFLSEHIASLSDFIDAAAGYVSFTEWVGNGSSYDANFCSDEFRFAVSDAIWTRYVANLPEMNEEGVGYETSGLSDPTLDAEQRRDFALRSIRAMALA